MKAKAVKKTAKTAKKLVKNTANKYGALLVVSVVGGVVVWYLTKKLAGLVADAAGAVSDAVNPFDEDNAIYQNRQENIDRELDTDDLAQPVEGADLLDGFFSPGLWDANDVRNDATIINRGASGGW